MAKKQKSSLTPVASVKSDAQWRAESDARTLGEAAAIKADSARMKAAAKEGKKLGEQKMAEAKALMNLNQKKKPTF